MKERDTEIIAIRIKKTSLAEVMERLTRIKKTRNAWLIWCIKEGLRKHGRKDDKES